MHSPFIFLYRFFRKHRIVFTLFFVLLVTLCAWRAWQLNLEEDISKFFPDDARVEKVNTVFQHSRMAEQLVMMISVSDSSVAASPDSLVYAADVLAARLKERVGAKLRSVRDKVDDERVLEMFETVKAHLPVFLDESDYAGLEKMTDPAEAERILRRNYQQLVSPSGIVTKNIIAEDPLGISFLVLKKLQHLQYDENFVLYDNYILTADHRHLLFFADPVYPPSDTKNNALLLAEINEIIGSVGRTRPMLNISCFGAAVVAAGNAAQLQQDTFLTLGLMVAGLILVLWSFFRSKSVPLLIFVPVITGALFSLACISFIQSSLSVLALAVGAVILGVAVDYSLHFLVHVRYERNVEQAIRDLVRPLTIGSLTTVLAFLSLQYTNAPVLQDVGLFAGLSLIGAALGSLVILPQLLPARLMPAAPAGAFYNRLSAFSFESRKPLVYLILAATPVFLFFAGKVKFNSDMGRLNFMTEETRLAQERLETISKSALSSVYITASSKTLEQAMRRHEAAQPVLHRLKEQGLVTKLSAVSSFLVSDSLQRERIKKWETFWTSERAAAVTRVLQEMGAAMNFSQRVIENGVSIPARQYHPLDTNTFDAIRHAFFDDLIIERDNSVTVVTMARVSQENKQAVYSVLEANSIESFDRQLLTNLLVEYVNADFNYIVGVTSVIVFLALLLAYGRIELTLITFLPMLVTWIWILGIMALLGIEFNIVNIMVSTFIFGLGDDYSIFITDGLQQEYTYGKKALGYVRVSVFLSAVTTICGLGVLIFAKHPALVSIASISIIGIACVFVMSQTLQPFIFRLLITNRVQKNLDPMTVKGIVLTIYTYGFFVVGSFFLTIVGVLLRLIPFGRKKVDLFFHVLISGFTRVLVYGAVNLHKRYIGKRPELFRHPCVLISNHSSFLDILICTMLHPKVVLLTNAWVWNSPIFGGVVRLAGYYPVMEGAEQSAERLRAKVKQGYSIVVFPEGTRSEDGRPRRFHKGAFFIAEQLSLPVQPLMIHGASHAIPKGTIYVNDSHVTMKFLPEIRADEDMFGDNYSDKAKQLGRFYRARFEELRAQCETPRFFRKKLFLNYLYKGPVLEWYMRIKVSLENNYEQFNKLVPARGKILDLGCGYGFLAYMLQFVSEEREITGVDYDEEKIAIARNGYLRTNRLQFVCADATTFPLGEYDAIIISDVLHYLTVAQQQSLLVRCMAALRRGGKLIIRDGNRDLEERHRGTALTEFFSVRVMGFNKSTNPLNFISGNELARMAEENGFRVKIEDNTKYTSNVIFVIAKPENVHAAV